MARSERESSSDGRQPGIIDTGREESRAKRRR